MRRVLSAGFLALACAGCSKSPQALPDQTTPIAAQVLQVQSRQQAAETTLTGAVVSRQVADISSQVMAPISEVRVHEGDMVRKGEVLVRLSSPSLAAGVEQAKATLAASQKQAGAAAAQASLAAQTYARYDMLNQRHSVTPQEFDQVKAQLAQTQAQQQAAAAQVQAAEAARVQSSANAAYAVITAPFSGVISGKYVDAGAMATPGSPLLRIENPQSHELDVQVNESSLHSLQVGQRVQVLLHGESYGSEEKVLEIVPAGDPAAHTFTVKIALPPSTSIYSGMTADVQIPGGEQNALTIPVSAVRHRGQLDAVLALDDKSNAQIRYVSLGRTFGSQVEVLSGLLSGDRILADPKDALIGRRIEPRA